MMRAFNPIDKVPDLTRMLQSYNPIIHSKADEGYEWMDEKSVCIELANPQTNDHLTILCEADREEFTVCYSYWHFHNSANDDEYNEMCRQVFDLLNSKCCVVVMLCGNKWLGSRVIEKEMISLPMEEIFPFMYQDDKYLQEIRTKGAEVRFIFWNSGLNKTIQL